MEYKAFFSKSFPKANQPYHYQSQMAGSSLEPSASSCESRLIVIPTGMGKTAAVIHAWLWNRVHRASEKWPRRLVYCLPMRTLAEQTFQCVDTWLKAHDLETQVGLHLLMGGESSTNWEQHPEAEAILIGTQDMILSRALNRGYGMSRFRWPMHYALLNNDCLWVFDEVQLMGAGLPTTAQLAAFRENFGTATNTKTWWMSATNKPDWLHTVDFSPETLASPIVLEEPDLRDDRVTRLRNAKKSLQYCEQATADSTKLAKEIISLTTGKTGLSLIVVNTVKKAKELHSAITKQLGKNSDTPILLHSQFRPAERRQKLDALLGSEGKATIAISTQIIEAGVDISAARLFTEMAPWSSLVQRCGRCNRRGTEADAQIFLIKTEKPIPYTTEQLQAATLLIDSLIANGADASPASLADIPIPDCDKPASKHVIRKRDFIDLFDTTPDLAGNDIDIERWIRDADETKINLFWRTWEGAEKGEEPPSDKTFPAPHRSELCPAPIAEARDWAKNSKLPLRRWDHLTSSWQKVAKEFGNLALIPGQTYLAHCSLGGYSPETGFDPKSLTAVTPLIAQAAQDSEATASDPTSQSTWQSIAVHTDHVVDELQIIMRHLGIDLPPLLHAARWHDLGKAHPSFKAKIKVSFVTSPEAAPHLPLAKAPQDAWHSPKTKNIQDLRAYFRHELASALAVIHPAVSEIPAESKNLVAWLIAAHHGKIRLSIRSLPDETTPDDPTKRFARGVWDCDSLESVHLGGGITSPPLTLSLEPMELGLCQEPPFENQPSWTERMLALRDHPQIGPLRLAYWETLLRAADERASAKHP
jgi:CRISPR-associated endonuclease/helicase Cas3